MSSIFHVIEEELDRLMEAKAAYEAAIEKEVKGSPQIKHIGRKDYLYLARREGSKIQFRYVGNTNEPKAIRAIESVKRRREYENLLKGVKSDLREVRKALRGRKI